MDIYEYSKLSNNLNSLALNIMYKIDVLRGYCLSKSPELSEADMIAELLEEILDSQKNLMKNIDIYSAMVENTILSLTY